MHRFKPLNLILKNAFFMGLLILFGIISCKQDKNKTGNSTEFGSSSKNLSLGSQEVIIEILSDSKSNNFFYADSVLNFYAEREYSPVWSNTDFRKSFIETLKKAESEGLYFKDYHGEQIQTLEDNLDNRNEQDRSHYDILLTDAFFNFSSHLLNGKTDPQKIHEIFDLPKNQANLSSLLKNAVSKNDLEIVFSKLRPNHPVYHQLIGALKEYKEKIKETDEFKEIESGEMIKPGMQDPRISKIAFRLMILGYMEDIDSFSSNHSENIQEAIKQLQFENGLLADGIIGNSTIKLLNIDYQDRYNQILANLERWRWYPRDLGDHYVLVNIANYNLEVVKDDNLVKNHKTMVGISSRKTPIFSEEIKYLVFNPDWTIPPTIKTKDVIPGARKDSEYLSKKNIDVYNSSGEQLDPGEIDWSSNKVKSYTYRQKPGSSNPLGKVKIIYPNKHLIYLHDTPSKSLFSRNSRAQSSGCIRVEDAIDLSKYLLSDQAEYSSEKIDKLIEKGDLKTIKMKQSVKVHHLYWTAWIEDDEPRFTEDIYNYDEKIIAELNKFSKP